VSSEEIGIEQARKILGPLADAASHGKVIYLTRGNSRRRIAAIVPIDRIKEPAMAATAQDLAYQVSLTLGDHIADFDIDGIVEEIRETYGPVGSIDDIPGDEYNALIERHDKSANQAAPKWRVRVNVIDGVITIEHDGEDTDIMRAPDGRLISTLIRVEPWAEDEEDLDRADAALAAEGLVRDGEWQSEGDGYVCQVRLAVGEASTFRRTREEDPDGWGDDVITITQDGGQVTEKFHVDGIDDTNHSGFSDEDEAAEYIRRRGIELESDGYRRD
jgi:hypothetical protein